MKPQHGSWGNLFDWDKEEHAHEPAPLDLDETHGDGAMFLEEAHEALSKLAQKTNKRGRLMRQPRRAESWQ